jgi:hypothetical protein
LKTHASQEIDLEKAREEKIAKFTDSLAQHFSKERLQKDSLTKVQDIKVSEINGNDIETDALEETEDGKMMVLGAKNMKQYDSLHNINSRNRPVFVFLKPFAEKIFHMQEQGMNKDQIFDRFSDTFVHTIPKALFVYLPLFAFFLWIFHNKKKWWFFDHGIFSLHYFSFLLLGTLILIFYSKLSNLLPDNGFLTILNIIIYTAAILYISLYFFVAHHRVYESSRTMSVFKGIFLFLINSIGIMCMFLILMYVSFLMMH